MLLGGPTRGLFPLSGITPLEAPYPPFFKRLLQGPRTGGTWCVLGRRCSGACRRHTLENRQNPERCPINLAELTVFVYWQERDSGPRVLRARTNHTYGSTTVVSASLVGREEAAVKRGRI